MQRAIDKIAAIRGIDPKLRDWIDHEMNNRGTSAERILILIQQAMRVIER